MQQSDSHPRWQAFASLSWYDGFIEFTPQADLWYNEQRLLLTGAMLETSARLRRTLIGGPSMTTLSPHVQNDNPPMKRCPSCPDGQQWHPATAEFFHRDKGSKDGLICWCKVCKSQKEKKYNQRPEVWGRQKARREQNKERIAQQGKTRYEASKQQILATMKTQYQVNREHYRFWAIAKRYGLSAEKWNDIFEQQKGRCALCDNEFDVNKSKFIQVDHCHSTGVIRGLLCTKCNVGLGAFGDSPEMLLKAIQYLESYQEGRVV